jgi:hypothetical protein
VTTPREQLIEASPRRTGICVTCGASFSYLPSQVSGRFCSKRCAGATQSVQLRKQRAMIGGSLMSVQDIMTKYGVCRRTVVRWKQHFDFPESLVSDSAGAQFFASAEVDWWVTSYKYVDIATGRVGRS